MAAKPPTDRPTSGVVNVGIVEDRDQVLDHVPHREALPVRSRTAVATVVQVEDPIASLDQGRHLRPLAAITLPAVAEQHGGSSADVLIEEAALPFMVSGIRSPLKN